MVPFVDFMVGRTVPLWALTVLFSAVVWTPVKGEPRVIGPLQPVVAAPGDDVVLPCHLEPEFNVERQTVEWSKPDLKPDPSDRLSRVEYVHVYRDRREVLDMKLRSYVKRTLLFPDGLKRGNISLKITNVTLADAGRYKCFIPKLKSNVKESIVQLVVVDPDSVKVWTTETPLHPRSLQTPDPKERTDTEVKGGPSHLGVWISAVCVVLLAGGVGGCVLIKHKLQKQNLPKYDAAPSKQLPL
ncbi:myelin-oligodendrocyte glycoprotein-like [Siniperca chuatsi]|uniref:myelin-oligodendrocyte glycoprotein-like n=1 Tax=Siniperca chuatsi TaxID=119488 RepID=UPI001CE1A54D|nr:myelin-oligodendrocyte glycoprotein-like [Siniperca chuatsi]